MDNLKYTLMDSNTVYPYHAFNEINPEMRKTYLSSIKNRISDCDVRIEALFQVYCCISYVSIVYFGLISLLTLICVLLNEQMPPILFWVVFMTRNIFFISAMLMIIKAKGNRNDQTQSFAIVFLCISIIFSLLRFCFNQYIANGFGTSGYEIPWPRPIYSIMNTIELFFSFFVTIYLLIKALRLKSLLELREALLF